MSVGHDQGFHVIKSQGHRSKLKVNAVCNAVGLTSIIDRGQFFLVLGYYWPAYT